jgi:hypothetical protein
MFLTKNTLRKVLCAASVIALTAGHARLAAQSVELGASFGWYQPLWGFRLGPIASTDLPQHANDLRGIAWGAEARVPVRDRFGVEAVFTTAASTVPGCLCPGGYILPPTGERVNLAAVEGLYRIPIGGRNEVSFGLGPAMIQHGGEGYGRYGSPKSWGGLGGIEVSHSLTSHVEAAARALAAAYSFHLDFPPQSGPQLDLVISLSIRWRFRAASLKER